jgi:hypothetical protein
MEFPIGAGFVTSVLGGVIVAASNWLFSREARKKTLAETDEVRKHMEQIDSQIANTNAATEKTKAETLLLMKPQARSVRSDVWGEPPAGWLAGNVEGASDDYVVGIDQAQVHSGKTSAYIRAKADDPQGFGALSQRFMAGSFRGTRLRLTGYLRVQSVEGWAGLWMRIDGADGELQGFDNMERRPVRGTSEWVRRQVVLNVPPNAYAIAIGALLVGTGQIWVDDFALDVVGSDVPTTVVDESLSQSPVNLKFEDS